MNNKIMKTNIEHIFYKLIEIAEFKKIDVLTNFRGARSFLWDLRDKKILLINETEELSEKLSIICEVLRETDLEDIYIKPYIRELIYFDFNEKVKEYQKIDYCEVCHKPIYSKEKLIVKICKNCFKFQVKYGLNLEGCKKSRSDNECMDCPGFQSCETIVRQLYPNKSVEEIKDIIKEKNTDTERSKFNNRKFYEPGRYNFENKSSTVLSGGRRLTRKR